MGMTTPELDELNQKIHLINPKIHISSGGDKPNALNLITLLDLIEKRWLDD